ncbi:MAG: hypothetical protein ACE5LF_02980 [Alphaproteobacteria bacterium]
MDTDEQPSPVLEQRSSCRDEPPRDVPAGGQAGPSSPLDKLREIARCCRVGEPLGPGLALWLGSALHGYLTRQYRTVEQALNLRFPQGGVPWWREEAIRVRDAALRALAERFFGDLSPCAQAHKIWTIAWRYAASAWRFDDGKADMPRAYTGTPKEYLWRAFKSGATMPLGERQLRNILAY